MKNKLTADNYTSVVTFGHVVKLLRSDSSMALQEGAHFCLLSLTQYCNLKKENIHIRK